MKQLIIQGVAIVLYAVGAQAYEIGYFPGLKGLIKSADAIVILRIDKTISEKDESGYSTHDCYIYQSLKGDIPAGKVVRLQLMDTRTTFASPFSRFSTHLMFLTRKRLESEATDYRTIEFEGANVRVSPLGQEVIPAGKTVEEKVKALLTRALEYDKKEANKESEFINLFLKGAPGKANAATKK